MRLHHIAKSLHNGVVAPLRGALLSGFTRTEEPSCANKQPPEIFIGAAGRSIARPQRWVGIAACRLARLAGVMLSCVHMPAMRSQEVI